eukprot:TRINITY_DN17357_c0_g1_i8.p1 TRINITY_DN17357_c0_g1~~TRINITY_DN17357_c0_g1_i8.p1  ORF type:complete len:483 (+),score=73.54 TRINITY_DN17357_c0_g1_i8:198-1451(+)
MSLIALPASYDFQGTTPGFRGMRFAYPDLDELFEVGRVICWYTNKSCATERWVMEKDEYGFCGSSAGPRTIFIIHDMKGKRVKRFSPFPTEEEVVLRAMTFLKVRLFRKGDHKAGNPFDGHADIIELEMLTWSPPRSRADVLELVREHNIAEPPQKTKQHPETALVAHKAAFQELQRSSGYFAGMVNKRRRTDARERCRNTWTSLSECCPMFLTFSDDGTSKLWVLDTGECLRTFKGHCTHWVTAGTMAGSDKFLTFSDDRTCKFWSLDTGECLRTFEGHTHYVTGGAMAGDDKLLTFSADRTCKLWRLDTGECLRTFKGHTWVIGVAMAGDDKFLTFSRDHTCKLWRLDTGECLRTFEGHTDGVTGGAMAGDDKFLTFSADHTCKLWRLDTGECLRTFEGHTDWVRGGFMACIASA